MATPLAPVALLCACGSGRTVKTVVDPQVGHAWLPAGPTEVRAWFDAHP